MSRGSAVEHATSDWERLYFDDFDVWCERQIEALNRHKDNLPADLDAERIAEELQLMQRRERLDAEAQIMRVIEHLLKLQYATEHEPRGRVWWRAVHGARSALDVFATPSLKPKLEAMLPEMYERARARQVRASRHRPDLARRVNTARLSLHVRADPRRGVVAGMGRPAEVYRLITGCVRPGA